MPRQFVPIVTTVFVMLFLWLSAVPLLSWYEFSAYHQDLADESFQWHHEGINDYSFEFEIIGIESQSNPGPIRIHVRDAKFVAAYGIGDNDLVDITGLPNVPDTIESVFELARNLIEEHPYRIDIEYDDVWHFPTSIAISYGDSKSDRAIYNIRSFAQLDDSPDDL